MAQNTASIYLYTTGECRANEFIEGSLMRLNNDGAVYYVEFIEGADSIYINNTAFYAAELLERVITYLTDESDVYLIDESGNYLTSFI